MGYIWSLPLNRSESRRHNSSCLYFISNDVCTLYLPYYFIGILTCVPYLFVRRGLKTYMSRANKVDIRINKPCTSPSVSRQASYRPSNDGLQIMTTPMHTIITWVIGNHRKSSKNLQENQNSIENDRKSSRNLRISS